MPTTSLPAELNTLPGTLLAATHRPRATATTIGVLDDLGVAASGEEGQRDSGDQAQRRQHGSTLPHSAALALRSSDVAPRSFSNSRRTGRRQAERARRASWAFARHRYGGGPASRQRACAHPHRPSPRPAHQWGAVARAQHRERALSLPTLRGARGREDVLGIRTWRAARGRDARRSARPKDEGAELCWRERLRLSSFRARLALREKRISGSGEARYGAFTDRGTEAIAAHPGDTTYGKSEHTASPVSASCHSPCLPLPTLRVPFLGERSRRFTAATDLPVSPALPP